MAFKPTGRVWSESLLLNPPALQHCMGVARLSTGNSPKSSGANSSNCAGQLPGTGWNCCRKKVNSIAETQLQSPGIQPGTAYILSLGTGSWQLLMMWINCLGRVNPAQKLGGSGLFREGKKQEVSRGFLLPLWSFLLTIYFDCKTNKPCFLRLLPFPGPLSAAHFFLPSQPGLIHISFLSCPLCSWPQLLLCGFCNCFFSLEHLLQSSYLDESLHIPLRVCLCFWPFLYLWTCISHLQVIFLQTQHSYCTEDSQIYHKFFVHTENLVAHSRLIYNSTQTWHG